MSVNDAAARHESGSEIECRWRGDVGLLPYRTAALSQLNTAPTGYSTPETGLSLLIRSSAHMRRRVLAATAANADPTIARIVGDVGSDTTGSRMMVAIVLGILALSGFAPTRLVLNALLEVGCFSNLTSVVIGGMSVRAFRPAPCA
jgi:hypothetical protein